MSVLRKIAPAKTAVAIVCLCALLSACGKSDYRTVDGARGNFADLRGKWLVINYWAEWCKPCIEEMPELAAFQREYAAAANVLAVNYDNAQGDVLRRHIEELRIELPVLLEDPAAKLGYQRPEVLPTTLIFTPEGKLKETLVGPQTVATLAAAMAQPVTSP